MRSDMLRAALGPGLLMAGAAVGVSHLVQATRAGAEYGFLLLGLVLAACILKYPFLEYGPRYAAATGESLLDGYRRIGRWAVGLYALITFGTMFVILATVTVVTAGLAGLVFGLTAPVTMLSLGVLLACAAILAIGRFPGLDGAMKVLMSILAMTTLVALGLAFGNPEIRGDLEFGPPASTLWTGAGIAFLLALMGWMPIPLDVAAWHSLWTLERSRQTGRRPELGPALWDFKLGFFGATALAAAFLMLGAAVMYGTGERFAETAVGFSGQLVALYGATLGEWSETLIGIIALLVMFSTTLAVSDAYPRVLRALVNMAHADTRVDDSQAHQRALYAVGLILVTSGALVVIHYFGDRFTILVDFATTLSFLSAPVLAWLGYRAVTGPWMPPEARPGPGLRRFAWAGMGFLIVFVIVWGWWRIF